MATSALATLGIVTVTASVAIGCSGDLQDEHGASGGAGPAGASGAPTGGTPTGGSGGGGGSIGTTGGSNAGGSPAGGTGPATGGSGPAGAGGMGASSGAAGSTATGGAGGSGGGAGSPGCGTMGKTGTFQDTITSFGLERGYYVSVPATYDSSKPNRLVFGYHGSNYDGMRMRQYLDLERAPLVEGTVFVYPDGLPLDGQPDNIAWELDADGRDMPFFDDLLAKMRGSYCIDPERIFVNGQSYGGLMTNALGCLRGNVIRAIAVVAGSGPRGSACQGQVAAWLTHGMDDDSVSFTSGEASRDHWVEANHCTTTTMPGTPEQCQVYQGCDPGYPVIWCPHVNDGGHQHPSFGRAAVREFLAGF